MTHQTQMSDEMLDCIQTCQRCQQSCLNMVMNFCLESGGQNIAPEHFRVMMSWAEMCQTTTNAILSSSPVAGVICAEVCDAWARSCEQVGGMETCVQECRICADICEEMAVKHGGYGSDRSMQYAA